MSFAERRALIFVGLSVLRNLLGLVSSVFCWGWCSPFVGLSVLRNMLGLVGFPPMKFTTANAKIILGHVPLLLRIDDFQEGVKDK